MYALVDCNNFYVSCERLFEPALEGRPVIVLSNNDGCAIARSEEAKALGIRMGTPAFMIKEVIRKNNVKLFSSNYTLYQDMSERVMKTLTDFVPRMEMYSIDEAFLDMSNMALHDLVKIGKEIRKTVKKNIGIPVSVGIAPTKTLAKMANRYAKKKYRTAGVFYASSETLINEMLAATAVNEIWGIGRQYALLLNKNGFETALDLKNVPEEWMRKNMTVQGQRLLNEIRGIPSFEWEFEAKTKKNICTSRSFGNLQTDEAVIKEALCNHAASCAAKLRKEKTVARSIEIFVNTNPHKPDAPQYSASITVQMETASNDTPTIIKHVLKGFNIIFKAGYEYMKCGTIMLDLIPEDQVQYNLFADDTSPSARVAVKAMDKINASLGKDTVRFAVQGYEKKYRLKAVYLSKKYTTDINEVIKITK
jgi:DNA polymerase V